MCNAFGTFHGGAVCTLVDIATSLVASILYPEKPFHVSLAINCSMLRSIPMGKWAYVLCQINKKGKNVIFLTCLIYDEEHKLCFKGDHLKSFTDVEGRSRIKPSI